MDSTPESPDEDLPRAWRIRLPALQLAQEASKDIHPREFAGLLRVGSFKKRIIEELILLPGTTSTNNQAIFQLHMLPIDRSIAGTIHSHPSSITRPSGADLALFNKYGRIHIILGHPFGPDDWQAYDHQGGTLKIEVIGMYDDEDEAD